MINYVLKRNVLSGMIAALLLVFLPSMAKATELTVENNTGQAIVELSLSTPGDNEWGDNLLPAGSAIAVGEAASVPIADQAGPNDLRALLDNGGQELYSNIDFTGLSRLRLNSQGTVEVLKTN